MANVTVENLGPRTSIRLSTTVEFLLERLMRCNKMRVDSPECSHFTKIKHFELVGKNIDGSEMGCKNKKL